MALVLERFLHSRRDIQLLTLAKATRFDFIRCSFNDANNAVDDDKSKNNESKSHFRVLELYPKKEIATTRGRQKIDYPTALPRTTKMNPDMDWTNIWPGPKTFHPASVPLPIRQGRNKHGPPPTKNANTELMKIPNFLHLTPPAIEKHCNAIKKFCTEWPTNLKTDEDIEKHFPIEVISSDYCHSSASIREPKARVITLRIKLKNLNLDKHAKDKFLRIVGPRYDPVTDYVTITTDSCPLKKQNYEYAHYLLTAIYFESWKFEDWEKMKSDDDMEEYIFSQRKSFQNIKEIFEYNKKELPQLEEYKKAVEDWQNKGDDPSTINNYKAAAMKLLSVPPLET